MDSALIEKTIKYVKLKTTHEAAGHDWFHIERVWKMAKLLQAREGGDLFLIEMAALLHNVGDHNYHEFDEEKGMLALFGMMDILEIDEQLKGQIIAIVKETKYKGNDTNRLSSLEGKIVQDANWLDSLGAIGVSRVFAGGGYIGRAVYDPSIPPRTHMTKFVYQKKKRENTSINSFYEKAFRLPDLVNTATAKKIALHRLQFIKVFLDQFLKEANGKDLEEILNS